MRENINKETNAMRVALSLQRNGVKYIFGQSNPPTVTLACDDIGIKQIGYRQENSGTYMAQAFGMCTNSVPVVTAQHGPAATLLVAGLAESFKASYPVVALVEEVSQLEEEKNAFQEIDHVELFKGVSKWTRKIPTQERIEEYIDMAFKIAASGRPGPTVLLLPKNIINDVKEYEYVPRGKGFGTFPLDRFAPSEAIVEEALDVILDAENPIIYAGGGVVSSGASDILKELQDKASIPVATTTMGKGSVDEKHPLTIGPIGYYMGKRGISRHLKPFVQDADVIVLIGNRTNQNGTDSWTLLPENARYIHIDIDPIEIDRNYDSMRLVGDARTTLQILVDKLPSKNLSKRDKGRASAENVISGAKAKHEEDMEEFYNRHTEKIKVETFLREVDKQLENNHIITSDASISSVWSANYLSATDQRKFIFPRGLAGLGWGFPMGMGAKLADQNKKVFCLVGDGGFGHVWSELETCKRLRIPLVIVVINNSILGYQKYAENAMFGRATNVCDFSFVDHTKIAEACGIKSFVLEDNEKISETLQVALALDEPVVIDLISDEDNIPPITTMDHINE